MTSCFEGWRKLTWKVAEGPQKKEDKVSLGEATAQEARKALEDAKRAAIEAQINEAATYWKGSKVSAPPKQKWVPPSVRKKMEEEAAKSSAQVAAEAKQFKDAQLAAIQDAQLAEAAAHAYSALSAVIRGREEILAILDEWIEYYSGPHPRYIAVNSTKFLTTAGAITGTILLFTPAMVVGGIVLGSSAVLASGTSVVDYKMGVDSNEQLRQKWERFLQDDKLAVATLNNLLQSLRELLGIVITGDIPRMDGAGDCHGTVASGVSGIQVSADERAMGRGLVRVAGAAGTIRVFHVAGVLHAAGPVVGMVGAVASVADLSYSFVRQSRTQFNAKKFRETIQGSTNMLRQQRQTLKPLCCSLLGGCSKLESFSPEQASEAKSDDRAIGLGAFIGSIPQAFEAKFFKRGENPSVPRSGV